MTMMQSINSKPAAGLLGGAITTLAVGLLSRYTSYNPDGMEAAAITTVASFVLAWLVPERVWSRAASNVEVDQIPVDPHEGAAG
jgi:ABC-type Fe3+ transport system permease subunit